MYQHADQVTPVEYRDIHNGNSEELLTGYMKPLEDQVIKVVGMATRWHGYHGSNDDTIGPMVQDS